MIEALLQLFPLAQEVLLGLWMVFLRVGAMIAVLPVFGEQVVPVRVRLGLALAFTLIVAPAVQTNAYRVTWDLFDIALLSIPEAMTGLFFGVLLRFFVMALQIAGSIAGQSTSLSQIFGSAGVDPQPAMGHFLVYAGLALAAMAGLHVQFSFYIIQTYEMVPVGVLIDSSAVLQLGLERVAHTFLLGFSLAAPFVIASFLYNVTLGVINRAMPQLMVSFVGAPAITAGGLALLLLSSPIILTVWMERFASFVGGSL